MVCHLLLVCDGLADKNTLDALFHGILLRPLDILSLCSSQLGWGEWLDVPLSSWSIKQFAALLHLWEVGRATDPIGAGLTGLSLIDSDWCFFNA